MRETSSVERRMTIPQEIGNPEDCVVGEGEGPLFDEIHKEQDMMQQKQEKEGQVQISDESINSQNRSPWVKELHQWPKEFRNILAGGIAGIVAKSFVAPVDRIKILYQVSTAQFEFARLPSVIRSIIREEGFTALWKGNTATLLRVFPYSGIQFMMFDQIKMYFLHRHQHHQERIYFIGSNNNNNNNADKNNIDKHKFGLTPAESLIAGMIAGTVSVICTYPLDLTRAQLAVLKKHKHGPNKNFIAVLRDNHAGRGIPGLFRGITPTLLGILPYSGIAFALNEQGKREIQHVTGRDVTTMERMQCGAFAGLVAQSVTYPIEVTRRRMQTMGLVQTSDTAIGELGQTANAIKKAAAVPTTLTQIIRDLYVEQGVRGFYKGVTMNWIKGPLAFSISFTTFDIVQSFMESPREHADRLPKRFITRKLQTRPS